MSFHADRLRETFNHDVADSAADEIERLENERDALQRLITECTVDGEIDSRLFNAYIEHVISSV